MGLANLYNLPVDPVALNEWSFAHADNHAQIIRAVLAQKNTILLPFVLDPINPNDMAVWEYQHQIMHNQMNEVLGIQGQTLVGIDWQDPDALSEFIDTNANEHIQASSILGIG